MTLDKLKITPKEFKKKVKEKYAQLEKKYPHLKNKKWKKLTKTQKEKYEVKL